MLSSALNFLSDKRKRFHRSDTMPAFSHVPNLYKLADDLNDLESCSDQRPQASSFRAYHPVNSKIRDDLVHLRIETGSNGDLLSLADRTDRFLRNDPAVQPKHPNLTRSSELGGSDIDLTSRFKRDQDSPSPKAGSRPLSNRNQEAKLKFLNLPAMTPSPTYGATQLGNDLMTSLSRSGTNSSPTTSMMSWNSKKSGREDALYSESDRELFKKSTLKVEHMETVVVVSSSVPENDLVEDLIDSTMGDYGRVARLQTKSKATRSVKNKAKRSKSTVHMSRRMRDSSGEEMARERACSAQRKPNQNSNDLRSGKLNDDYEVQSTKFVMDKTSTSTATTTTAAATPTTGNSSTNDSRSRSFVLPGAEQEGITIQDSKRNYELLMSLANRGTKLLYHRINAAESMETLKNKISDPGPTTIDSDSVLMSDAGFGAGGTSIRGSSSSICHLTSAGARTVSAAGTGTGGQFLNSEKSKPFSTDNLILSTNPTTSTSSSSSSTSKLNKYAVVRRLRRNNSSMTCNTDKTFRSLDEPVPPNSTCTITDDLSLPSHKSNAPFFANRSPTRLTQDKWIADLFTIVDNNDLEQFLHYFEPFHLLAKSLSPEAERLQNQYELNPLDCALLNGYVTLAIYMLICGFGPGPILQYNLKRGPPSLHKACGHGDSDTMRVHLENLLSECNQRLINAQEETKQTVEEANSMIQSAKLSKDANSTNTTTATGSSGSISQITALNQIYAKVGLKEQVLADNFTKQNQLLTFSRNLDQYPVKTKPPRQVRLMLDGPNSILVRITPSRLTAQHAGVFNQSDIVYNENSSCSSSDDLENSDWLSEGRKVSIASQSKLAPVMTLKYCIEWSHCPKFLNYPVYCCTVEPVFHLRGISQQGESIQIRNLNHLSTRTGFYLISNLPPGKMIFIRVYAFSIHGWSDPCYSQPTGINLSSWYECKAIVNASGMTGQPQQRYAGESLLPDIELQKQALIEKVVSWISGQSSGSHAPATNVSTAHASSSSNLPNSNSVSSISSGGAGGPTNISTNAQPNAIPTPTGSQMTCSNFDDPGKRHRSPMLQRKRSFRFLFSNKGFRFVKQVKSGLYLAVLCHTPIPSPAQLVSGATDLSKQKYQLVLADDALPMINVTREDLLNSGSNNLTSDFNWFSKLVSDSTGDLDVQLLCEDAMRSNLPTNLQLRIRLFGALQRLRFLLGTANMGTVYPELIRPQLIDPNLVYQKLGAEELGRLKVSSTDTNEPTLTDPTKKTYSSAVIVLLRQVNSPSDVCLTSNLRWGSMDKFLKQNKIKRMEFMPPNDQTFYSTISNMDRMINQSLTHYSHLLSSRGDQLLLTPEVQIISNLDLLLYYSANRTRQLEPGLYLALVQMQANLDQQATILVSNSAHALQMFPSQRIRRRSQVSREEWDYLFQILNHSNQSPADQTDQGFDIRDTERRFVVQLLRAWFKLANKLGFASHVALDYRIYLAEIIRLSPHHAIIPCFPPVDQVCLRPGLKTVTPPSCYWISMAHFERNLGLTYDPSFNPQLFHLISLLELLIPISQFIQRQCFTDQELTCSAERTQSLQFIQSNLEMMMQGKRWLSEILAAGRDRKRQDLVTVAFAKILHGCYSWLPGSILMYFKGSESSTCQNRPDMNQIRLEASPDMIEFGHQDQSLLMNPVQTKDSALGPPKTKSSDKSTGSIIQVYADYPSGLAKGTYVRLLIHSKTTAQEIIHIVTQQIKQTAQKQGYHDPSPSMSDLNSDLDAKTDDVQHSYCLTVSLDEIERPLPATIRPLLLRQPWRSGKFAVRLASQVDRLADQNAAPAPLPANDMLNPYRISKRHAFKLTIVDNPFIYAHVDLPPHILP